MIQTYVQIWHVSWHTLFHYIHLPQYLPTNMTYFVICIISLHTHNIYQKMWHISWHTLFNYIHYLITHISHNSYPKNVTYFVTHIIPWHQFSTSFTKKRDIFHDTHYFIIYIISSQTLFHGINFPHFLQKKRDIFRDIHYFMTSIFRNWRPIRIFIYNRKINTIFLQWKNFSRAMD